MVLQNRSRGFNNMPQQGCWKGPLELRLMVTQLSKQTSQPNRLYTKSCCTLAVSLRSMINSAFWDARNFDFQEEISVHVQLFIKSCKFAPSMSCTLNSTPLSLRENQEQIQLRNKQCYLLRLPSNFFWSRECFGKVSLPQFSHSPVKRKWDHNALGCLQSSLANS